MAGGDSDADGISSVMSEDEYTNSKLAQMVGVLDIDTDLWVFKRFSKLNLYNLLYLQHRLTQLEADLTDHLERKLGIDELMPTIQHTLNEYHNASLALSFIGKAPKPSQNAVSTLHGYSDNYLREIEDELNLNKQDHTRLMSLSETEKTWIHQFVSRHKCLLKYFGKGETANEMAMIYSESSVRRVERLVITLSFCALLLSPIILLSYTRNKGAKLGIVVSFVTGASLVTAGLTKARNWEILTVTAGYSAILVVFLSGNLGQ